MVCRLDVPYPVLEVADAPAAGHAISVGPVGGRGTATELADQLTSLFALRHCGRRLALREHPSAYGQMGRCLSPCLGDLDPNAYRRRLDEALAVFREGGDARRALLERIEARHGPGLGRARVRARGGAAAAPRADRAAARPDRPAAARDAPRRAARARAPSRPSGLGRGVAGRRPRHRVGRRCPAAPISSRARSARPRRRPRRARCAPEEVDDAGIVTGWLHAHPETPELGLRPEPPEGTLVAWAEEVAGVRLGAEPASPPAPPAGPSVAAAPRRAPKPVPPGQAALL